jgi:hypothetical protein
VLFYHYILYLWELTYSIMTGFICEICAILSLHGLFVRVVAILSNDIIAQLSQNTPCNDRIAELSQINHVVVLLYHYRFYLWDLCYSIITWFICESCAILSLHGLFVRVVLFYHYSVYLWESCNDRIAQLSQLNPVMKE